MSSSLPVSLALLVSALFSFSAFANVSVMQAEVLRAATGPQQILCSVDVLDEEERTVPVLKDAIVEIKEGDDLVEAPVGPYSVIFNSYLPKDGAAPRIQIAINSKTQQEDFISSSLKPVMYLSSLSGEIKNQDDSVTVFESILIDCRLKN